MPPVEPMCVKCMQLMFPRKNGIYVVFGKSTNQYCSNVNADLWECRNCGHQVIEGWGRGYSTPVPMEEFMQQVDGFNISVLFVDDQKKINWPKPKV